MSETDPRAEDWDTTSENAEHGLEAPEADAIEQQTAVGARSVGQGRSGDVPDDVDEADAAEQSIDVDLDDDDYR